MNHPQQSPHSRRPQAASRRHTAPMAPPSQVPWVGLTIWGLIIGLVAGIGIQLLRWTQPMFKNPPKPPFLADNPIELPSPSLDESVPSEISPEENNSGSDSSSTAESAGGSAAESEQPVSTTDPNSQKGRVIEPIGLAIRAEPAVEATYIGGIAYNETVTILELSGDGRWQRVRRDLNGQEGWVKAGNTTNIE